MIRLPMVMLRLLFVMSYDVTFPLSLYFVVFFFISAWLLVFLYGRMDGVYLGDTLYYTKVISWIRIGLIVLVSLLAG